ncbi:MAG: c-type cytochrome [Anaerolineae bacterium]
MNVMVVLVIVVALAVALLAAWAASKSWGLRNVVARWVVGVGGALLTLAAAAVAVVLCLGLYRLRNQDDHPIRNIEVQASAAALDRGEHLAKACAGCHANNRKPPLSGNDEENFLEGLGVLHPPNLTPGGSLADVSAGRIARAIREGVGIDGRPLLIMPSPFFHAMSDEDVAAIIAYLRSQPDEDNEVPARAIGPFATLLIGAGMFPLAVQAPIEKKIGPPDHDDEKAWGEYTATIMACGECHGLDFKGKPEGNGPGGPDIAHYADKWTDQEWIDTIRTGVDPTGAKLKDMPWKEYSEALSDDELAAMRAYIRTFAKPAKDK